jgi:pyruvate,water dikinase
MASISKHVSDWFLKKKTALDEATAQRLRLAFRDRYHHFKLLLTANNQALRGMADIESALQGDNVFGMAFVREKCTAVSVNVLRMVNSLTQLAPGRYAGLRPSFNAVNREVARIISARPALSDRRPTLSLADIDRTATGLAGSKMAMLGELKNSLGLKVPDGFAVTIHAYERFFSETGLRDEVNRLVQSADMADVEGLYALGVKIRNRIIQARIPEDIADAVRSECRALEDRSAGHITLAVRSSALCEDAAGSSFAGQYHSELNVRPEDLPAAYKSVIAGKYNLQAMIYRLNHGLRDEDTPMAVGCLRMVNAVAGGVVYSSNPVPGRENGVYINSVWGLPKSVVDGTAPCDLFVMSRDADPVLLREEIRQKSFRYAGCDTDSGLSRLALDAGLSAKPSLDDGQKKHLARIALTLEKYFESPRDIEWAVDPDGEICLLQCRPLPGAGVPAGASRQTSSPPEPVEIVASGGVTASPGAASGEVFVVEKHADIFKFPGGGVLVARQALPVWATLMPRAAAVVTSQGGVAGHLASVAREFNIPALFGVQNALNDLKTGETVTVDADNRKIYAGRVPELLQKRRQDRSPVKDTPVYNLLKAAGEWITPLHLLDPEDFSFSPENCKTYHDITRFIHEKSMHEMFAFGREHNFPERSGKQLHHRVPMQWWVLNLDDGFRRPVSGKYVRLEDIDSVPMLAFWKGFAAVPWDGPPALDHKGFLSVMFRSTTNPDLVTGRLSRYAEQNYFMISKNFCSLSSRLGYHFSITEALIGDRTPENYIRFQFKGGAADANRRIRRTEIIGEILEAFGFWVTFRKDHLSAGVREENQACMNQRMAILGYLTLHTRQLDMIMENSEQVDFYRAKLKNDIEKFILP